MSNLFDMESYHFSTTIQRGCRHRRLTGKITSYDHVDHLMHTISKIILEHYDVHGDLDGIQIRISRIKSKSSKS